MRRIEYPEISGEGASPEHVRQVTKALRDLCDQINVTLEEIEMVLDRKDGR